MLGIRHWYTPTPCTVAPPPQDPDYDCIVVGAGPAGATAAYFMAKAGLSVLLLERGPYPGAKNCGGSSIVTEPINELFPEFWAELPYDRLVTTQAYWLLTADAAIGAAFESQAFRHAPYNRLTVKRNALYSWLCHKARHAGATLQFNQLVTDILFEKQRAIGVAVGGCQVRSRAVILAEGAAAALARRYAFVPASHWQTLAFYVKETYALSAEAIESRFNLLPGQGLVLGLVGYPSAGFNATASLHVFRDTLNLNIGIPLPKLAKLPFPPYELLQRTKNHPALTPLLAGSTPVEYGAALIPEGGYHAIPPLVHDGVLLAGDTASLVNGTQGFNLAMWSGYYCAQTMIEAKQQQDFSRNRLQRYQQLLSASILWKELQRNANIATLQRDLPSLFTRYSQVFNTLGYQTSKVSYVRPLVRRQQLWQALQAVQPWPYFLRDLWKIGKALR